ncbi:UNVERIFIED_CONTAM: hypothetical protein FKN15_067180 [Acipenser sinensis]
MVFKPVICDNCMMWENRENPTELNQVCVKCSMIQDLLHRVSILEKELEEMRQQQELEKLTHPQFMEVCTPSRLKATREMKESRNSWVQMGRSREKKKLCQTQPPEIQTSNKFEPLQHLDDQNQHQENEKNNIQDPINSADQAAEAAPAPLLLAVVEAAGIHPLLVEVGGASSPPTAVEVAEVEAMGLMLATQREAVAVLAPSAVAAGLVHAVLPSAAKTAAAGEHQHLALLPPKNFRGLSL